MATEPLEYKISFDTSEVAQKLSEVKNAMDVAFGAQAFNTAGADAYPFQGMFEGATSMASSAMTSAQQGVQMAQGTFGSIQDAFSTMAETSRLGYSKFTRDLEMTGLMSGSMRGAPQPMTYGEHIQQIRQGDLWDDIMGGAGFGYSPTMPMSKKEYTRRHKDETLNDFMTPSWGEAIGVGAAAAFASGPVGWGTVAIGAAALGTKAALYPFTSELRHQRALEGFVSGTSWRFLSGELNREDTREIGQFLRELPDQPSMEQKGYTRSEVDETLSTFTEAGGFDYVRNAREYREKTKQLFEGHRELMHTLHVTSKEATSLMAQLSRDLGVDNFTAFSGEVAALATGAGLTRTEAASFMMKSAEMVRGTGYNMENFALGAGRMLEDVRNMAREGIISKEDLRQYGGEQNIALNMARSAMNYAGSPAGFVTQAALASAQLGGGGLEDVAGMSFQQKLGITAGSFRTPWDLLTFGAKQKGLADEMGPQIALMDKTAGYLDQLSMMVGDRDMTGAQFESALVTGLGVAPSDAKQMRYQFESAGADLPTLREQNNVRVLEAYKQKASEGISPFEKEMIALKKATVEPVWEGITGIAEAGYIGIENRMSAFGRGVSNLVYKATGGYFAPEDTRPQGIITAMLLGGEYEKQHQVLMNMSAEERAEMNESILSGEGNVFRNKITRTIGIATSDGRRAGFKLTEEETYLSEMEAKEARMRVGEYIDDLGKEEEEFSLLDLNPIVAAASLISNVFDTSEMRESIKNTSEALEMREDDYQTTLARMAYGGATEYEILLKQDKLPEGMSREQFIKKSMIDDLRAFKPQLGDDDWEDAVSNISNMNLKTLGKFVGQGISQYTEDYKTYMTEKRNVARGILRESGLKDEEITEDLLNKEEEKLTFDDFRANALGTAKKIILGREGADETYRERFGRQLIENEDLLTRPTAAGGVEFDPIASAQIQAANSSIIATVLTEGTLKVKVTNADEIG